MAKKKFKKKIVASLLAILNKINPHVGAFRIARDRFNREKEKTIFYMRIIHYSPERWQSI